MTKYFSAIAMLCASPVLFANNSSDALSNKPQAFEYGANHFQPELALPVSPFCHRHNPEAGWRPSPYGKMWLRLTEILCNPDDNRNQDHMKKARMVLWQELSKLSPGDIARVFPPGDMTFFDPYFRDAVYYDENSEEAAPEKSPEFAPMAQMLRIFSREHPQEALLLFKEISLPKGENPFKGLLIDLLNSASLGIKNYPEKKLGKSSIVSFLLRRYPKESANILKEIGISEIKSAMSKRRFRPWQESLLKVLIISLFSVTRFTLNNRFNRRLEEWSILTLFLSKFVTIFAYSKTSRLYSPNFLSLIFGVFGQGSLSSIARYKIWADFLLKKL